MGGPETKANAPESKPQTERYRPSRPTFELPAEQVYATPPVNLPQFPVQEPQVPKEVAMPDGYRRVPPEHIGQPWHDVEQPPKPKNVYPTYEQREPLTPKPPPPPGYKEET